MCKCIIISVVLLSFIVSCNEKEVSVKLIPIKESVIEIGYNYNSSSVGVCKDGNDELIYVSNLDIDRLRFFDFEGNLRQETFLSNILATDYGTDVAMAISMDTIMVSKFYPKNSLYFLDGSGAIRKELNLDSLVGNHKFEHRIVLSNNPLFGDKMVFNSMPIATRDYNSYDGDMVAYYRDFYNMKSKQPYILKLSNIFSNNVTFQYGLDGFCGRFAKPDYEAAMFGMYSFVNGHIFVYTSYSDTLYCLDNNTLNIDKKIKIKSNHTTIGKDKPRYIDKKSIADKEYHSNLFKSGTIFGILHYPQKDVYAVQLIHDPIKNKDGNIISNSSLLILDNTFNMIGECLLDKTGHLIGVSKNGIVMLSDVESNRKSKRLTVYDID